MPRLLLLEENKRGAQLYVLGLSTLDALRLFPADGEIKVTQFSGYTGFDIYRAFDNLPELSNIGQAVNYLEHETDLFLIDFVAALEGGGGATISTHDDGEATFQLGTMARAVALLDAVLTPSEAGREAVLGHLGCYVLIDEGATSVFATFEEAVASGRIR